MAWTAGPATTIEQSYPLGGPSPLRRVLALFTVGDVYASLCKRGAYAPFSRAAKVTSAILAVTPPGKPPPLAVRLEEALPFRRVIDDLLSMNREVQKRRSTCESGKANRT